MLKKEIAVSKTIHGIRKLRQTNLKNKKLRSFCKDLETMVTKEDYTRIVALYNKFEEMEDFLNTCHLDKLEKGYIFTKILKAHFVILDTQPYTVICIDNVIEEMRKFGLKEEEIPDLFLEYGKRKENFQCELKWIEQIKSILGNILNPKIVYKIIEASLRNNLDFKVVKTREKETNYFFEKLKATKKSYDSLKKSLSNLVYMEELKKFISLKTGMPLEESEELIYQFIIDPSLKDYEKQKQEELKHLLEIYVPKEEENRLNLIKFYHTIKQFMKKEQRSIKDYQQIGGILIEQEMPKELIECFLLYHLNSEKIEKEETKEEPKKSKKQIKRELAMYYEEDKQIPFDYYNLGALLKLLQESNYADNVKINILNGIWQNKIENEAYYAYLLEKNLWNRTEKEKTKEIKEILELMCYTKDKEEWQYFYEEALKICATLNSSVSNMDYEMSLMRK